MKFILINPSELPKLVESDGSLESLQSLVGGDIESLTFTGGACAYVDENAKIRQDTPPPNLLATRLMVDLGGGLFPGDLILGPMVIVGIFNAEGVCDGEEHDAPQHVVDMVMSYRL